MRPVLTGTLTVESIEGVLMDAVYTAIGIIVLIGWPITIAINALKRKWWFTGFAVLGSPWAIIGASRLARPGSWWYRKRYDDAKRARVNERYSELFTY